MQSNMRIILLIISILYTFHCANARHLVENPVNRKSGIQGRVVSTDSTNRVEFASVYLKGTAYGCSTDEHGHWQLKAPAGRYTLVVSCLGFATVEREVEIGGDAHGGKLLVELEPNSKTIEEVTVSGSLSRRIGKSAFNAAGIDTRAMQNSTQNLSDALRQTSGIKIRESGGVGSDMQLSLDGFTGRHVKVFIDGVPQEGVGGSFGLNNIPAGYADRIEVYKGVVPVGFGTDAIGGIINVVTKRDHNRWFADASYSYGSFNTHRSHLNVGQTLSNGLSFELNLFQNYSDNSYYVDATAVKHFMEGGGSKQSRSKVEHVRRFHDGYHNETVIGKIGVVGRSWADRLMLSLNYSQHYKEIQTDTRQTVAFGERHRRGKSLSPQLEYRKRDLLAEGLDLTLTANYNRNAQQNVDTSRYEYNWLGERRLRNGRVGEVSNQNTHTFSHNWNGTLTLSYRIGKAHRITLNHVMNTMNRETQTITVDAANDINKVTTKHISGLSYQLAPSERWTASVFAKRYEQRCTGPLATSSNSNTSYIKGHNDMQLYGYGAVASYYIIEPLLAKLSYELAYRLPTNDELFGNNDLERGQFELRPERSNNLNINIIYDQKLGQHRLNIEGGFIYRYTHDYIKRTTENVSGTYFGAYSNHGRVKTAGFNLQLRYNYRRWLSLGGNFTQMNVRDDEQLQATGSQQQNLSYGARMPNLPYQFANADAQFSWHGLPRKGCKLTVGYDCLYTHSFPLFSEVYGSSNSKMVVPTQLSHNVSIGYSFAHGRYNISFECTNLTNAQLFDNFNLQKAGRAFYGKLRISLGSRHNHGHRHNDGGIHQ